MGDIRQTETRATLLDALAALDDEDRMGQQSRSTVELDQQSVGRLSRMDALQAQAMANAAHERRNQQRARINAALARLDEGEYGYCVQCGDEIGAARLAVDPAIAVCLTCARG